MSGTETIQDILELIIEHEEGGWILTAASSSDPSGGWTYGGMTADRFYQKFPAVVTPRMSYQQVKNYLDTASDFTQFRTNCLAVYADIITESKVTTLPRELWHPYLSAYINSPVIAVKALQGMLNRVSASSLKIDGQLGPATQSALDNIRVYLAAIIQENNTATANNYLWFWAREYVKLALSNNNFLPDLDGWMARIDTVRVYEGL